MRSKTKRYKKREENKIENIRTLNIIVFVSTLSIFSLGSLIMPKDSVSELEKRELSQFPSFTVTSFFSGDYFKDIENYYNDTFPFRREFVNLASQINDMKGVRQGKDEIKIYTVKGN